MLVKGMKMPREGDGGRKSGFFFGDFLGPPCALARTDLTFSFRLPFRDKRSLDMFVDMGLG